MYKLYQLFRFRIHYCLQATATNNIGNRNNVMIITSSLVMRLRFNLLNEAYGRRRGSFAMSMGWKKQSFWTQLLVFFIF